MTAGGLMVALKRAGLEGRLRVDAAVWFRDDAGFLHRVWQFEVDRDGDVELSVMVADENGGEA